MPPARAARSSGSTLSNAHWKLILERMHEGRCVPFLGAGANASGHKYRGLPLGGDVALALLSRDTNVPVAELKKLARVAAGADLADYEDLARTQVQNLARVALRVRVDGDVDWLMTGLRQIIADARCKPSPILRTIAKLPVRLVVTTNYDGLMEKALQTAKRRFETVVQPRGGFDPAAQQALEDRLSASERPVLYKIHGSFGDGNDLIVTEEDYIEYLTVVGRENVGIPKLVAERMVDSTLLFLGYGLEDWDFRVLFKGLVETLTESKQRRSFALQRNPPAFWVDFWRAKGVVIYDVDLHDFAAELARRYAAYKRAHS